MVTPRVSPSGIRQLQSGFLAGELDPMMVGRVETDHHAYGLSLCENFIALELGPLVKRMGFQYVCPADPSSQVLSTFKFSSTQEYVLEWTNNRVRFYTQGGRVETAPGVAYELATPYATSEVSTLGFQQSFDRLYIDHPSHPPGAIVRTAATTFNYEVTLLKNGPFKDENTNKTITVTVDYVTTDGVSTTTTVHASSAIFNSGHVGALFRVEAADFSELVAWEPGRTGINIGEGYRNDGKEYVAQTAGTTGSIGPTHTEGMAWDGTGKNDLVSGKGPFGIKWKYLSDQFGIGQITAVAGDGLSATIIVLRQMPDGTTSPTWRWSHSEFSNAEGWPSIPVLWAGRMVHIKGFDVIGSVSGDYGGGQCNFQAYTSSGLLAADLAFRRTLSTDDPPQWALADINNLILGTASKELAVGPVNNSAVVAGDNIEMQPQSYYGSQPVRPVQIGIQTIFIEAGGRRLRAATFDLNSGRYVLTDLTASAYQISHSGLIQLAHLRLPFATLFALRLDGQIAVHSDSKLDVKGFSRMVLGGSAQVLSMAVVANQLWLLVERSGPVNGTTREVWLQSQWRDIGDPPQNSFYVDAGVKILAAASQVFFTGLTHLAGQAVAVLADGAVVANMTVANDGSLTLPSSAAPPYSYVLNVGLAYTATAVTLAPEIKVLRGTVQGLMRRVRTVMLRLIETLGISVGGDTDGDPLENVIDRSAADLMDEAMPLFTGDVEGQVDTDFDAYGRVQFVSDQPLPATIAAAAFSIEMDTLGA
jgi:hypothetical protein